MTDLQRKTLDSIFSQILSEYMESFKNSDFYNEADLDRLILNAAEEMGNETTASIDRVLKKLIEKSK